MPDFNNLSVVPPTHPNVPKTTNGQAQNGPAVRLANEPSVKKIAPLTVYNNDTGLLDINPESPWGVEKKEAAAATDAVETGKTEETKELTRNQKYLAEQAAKKEARQSAKTDKLAKQQLLAADHLKKGDLVNAAKALGMSPSDFMLYAQNAALSIETKQKEPTAEEKRVLEEQQFKAARDQEIEDLKKWKSNTVRSNFIKENIDPILADKDTFEFIHADNVEKVRQFIYNHMNKHYNDTFVYDKDGNVIKEGEKLDIKKLANDIENNLQAAYVRSLEAGKKLKKVAKYFAPEPEPKQNQEEATYQEEPEVQQPQPRARDAVSSLTKKLINKPAVAAQEEEDTSHEDVPVQPFRRNSTGAVPFALLSRAEREALLKAGK